MSRRWDKNMLEVLVRRYPAEGTSISSDLGVSPKATKAKAAKLGLKWEGKRCPPRCFPTFTSREDDILRDLYPHVGASGCREYLGRWSEPSIRARANYIGVRFLAFRRTDADG